MITEETNISDIYFGDDEIEAVYSGEEKIWPEYNFFGKVSFDGDNITNPIAERVDDEGNFKGYIDTDTTTINLASSFITEISQMPDLPNVTSAVSIFAESYLVTDVVSQVLNKIKNTVEYMGSAFSAATLSEGDTLDLSTLSLQKVNNISNMFRSIKADKIIMPQLNSNNVVMADNLFYQSNAKEIHFNGFTAKGLTHTKSMFYYCTVLETVDMTGVNLNNCNSFERMFDHCTKLTQINYPATPSDKVTSLKYMFNECRSITEIDLSKFVSDSAVITDISNLFYYCSKLKKIIMPQCFDSDRTYNLSSVFTGTGALEEIEGPFPTPTRSFSLSCSVNIKTESLNKIIEALERNPGTPGNQYWVQIPQMLLWTLPETIKQRALAANWVLTDIPL